MVGIHHIEIWLAEGSPSWAEWEWLLPEIGCQLATRWAEGSSWTCGTAYLTLTTSPNLSAEPFDRRQGGVNHLAISVDTRDAVDAVMETGASFGWTPLYQDRYPHAGGPDHYAGWLENSDGFKVEIVAG